MGYRTNLEEWPRVSNSRMLTRIPGAYKDNLRADVCLRVWNTPKGFEFLLFGRSIPAPDGEEGTSSRSAIEIFSIVERCRKEWTKPCYQPPAPAPP